MRSGQGSVGAADLRARRGGGPGGQTGHGARADHQHPATRELAAILGQQLVRRTDQRAPRAADPGLGLHPLAHPERLLEQGVQDGAHGAVVLAHGQRVLHLAEDLALPDHDRVEPGRHGEGVGDGAFVEVHRAAGLQVHHRQAGQIGERVGRIVQGAVEARHRRVELGAVAGGEHHRLIDVLGTDELIGEFGRGPRVESELPQLGNRCRLVRDADHQDAHPLVPLFMLCVVSSILRCSWKARIWSS